MKDEKTLNEKVSKHLNGSEQIVHNEAIKECEADYQCIWHQYTLSLCL